MVDLFGRSWTRNALLEHVGDISQVGGVRLVTFAEGPERDVLAGEVRTGSGFAFNVLPGRGMDIGFAEYSVMPLSWMSSSGGIAAPFCDQAREGCLACFPGVPLGT